MLVKDLKPRMAIEEMVLEIVSKGEVRQFANDRGEGKVCNVAAKDEAGEETSLTLWNEDVDKYNEGEKVKITNGWTSEFQGTLQVGTGKQGTIEKIE